MHVGDAHVLIGEDYSLRALDLFEEGDLGLELLDGLGVDSGSLLLWTSGRRRAVAVGVGDEGLSSRMSGW